MQEETKHVLQNVHESLFPIVLLREKLLHTRLLSGLNEWCYWVGLAFYSSFLEKGQNKRDLYFIFFHLKIDGKLVS